MSTPNTDSALVAYDPNRSCPKCGSTEVATAYRADSHYACSDHRRGVADPTDRFSCTGCDDEHFDRTCRRCRYKWREEVCAHRYPPPNGQGFHPDQCLDCLAWRRDPAHIGGSAVEGASSDRRA